MLLAKYEGVEMAWRMLGALALLLTMAGAGQGAAAATGYRVLDRIPGPDGGWDYVRIDAQADRVLVTRGGSVMAVDLATGKVAAGLAPGARLHTALPVNGGTEVLVTNGGGDAAVFFDAKTWTQVASTPTGKGPDSATLDLRSGLVLVMDHAGGEVTLIDPKRHTAVGTIEVGGALEEAAADGAGKAFVNVEDRNQIAVLDLDTRQVTARYPLTGCDGPTGLAYDAADRLLIVACDGATDLMDARDGAVVQTLPTGKGADGAAFDPRRRLAFIPAGRDGTLAVIAIAHGRGRIVETVPTRISARTIGLDERTGRLYLPSAQYVVTPGGGRPGMEPGSFQLLVVGK